MRSRQKRKDTASFEISDILVKIEVATHESELYSSVDQLKGFKKPRYIANTQNFIKKAKGATKGTKIGDIGLTGSIKKRAGG